MFPIITAAAIAVPIVYVPMSPGKILAGFQLNLRKTRQAANTAVRSIAAASEFVFIAIIRSASVIIAVIPASSPLYPAVMFIAFAAPVIPRGIIMNVYSSPKSMGPMNGRLIIVSPALIAIKGSAPIIGSSILALFLSLNRSSIIPIKLTIRMAVSAASTSIEFFVSLVSRVSISTPSSVLVVIAAVIATPPKFATLGLLCLFMSIPV